MCWQMGKVVLRFLGAKRVILNRKERKGHKGIMRCGMLPFASFAVKTLYETASRTVFQTTIRVSFSEQGEST